MVVIPLSDRPSGPLHSEDDKEVCSATVCEGTGGWTWGQGGHRIWKIVRGTAVPPPGPPPPPSRHASSKDQRNMAINLLYECRHPPPPFRLLSGQRGTCPDRGCVVQVLRVVEARPCVPETDKPGRNRLPPFVWLGSTVSWPS